MKDHEYKSPFVRRVAFYCQKVLPLVFDNSLSYYEALAHFAHKLNETIDGLNKQSMQILEFEKELALALDTFENELRQAQEDFETRIETEWSNFRADILRWQTELEGDWEVMKSELQTVEQLIQDKIIELDEDYTQYKADLTAQQTAFETAQTARQQSFETAQTTRQTNFENAQTTRQTNFENRIEQEVTESVDVTFMPYNGVQTVDQTDPATMSSIGAFPLDTNQVVQVYYKGANDSDYRFIKRRYYTADIESDSDIPAWQSYNDKFILLFENPIINDYIKTGCIPYATIGFDFGTQNRRLAIYKIPEIKNRRIDFSTAVLQGTYIQTGEALYPQPMTIVEQPMTATPNSYYTMFIIEQGCSKFIPQITQPTGATTRVYRGYIYSTFCGGVVRDPTVMDFRNNVNAVAFGGGNELEANTDLHSLTPGRYYAGQSNAPMILNRPESLNLGFNVECSSIFDRSTNRLKLRLYYNSPSTIGTFYECYLTSAGWSAWYKFTGTAVT